MNKKKLFIYTNFAVSLDGKIATHEREHPKPSRIDWRKMNELRSRADAVLIGANTLRPFQGSCKVTHPAVIKGLNKSFCQPLNVVLSRTMSLGLEWPFFNDPAIHRLIVTPRGHSKNKLKKFNAVAEILEYDPTKPYPAQLIKALEKKKISSLLIEGGGNIMFPWVEANWIDEWNITLMPKIIGGKDAPTMVEGKGFSFNEIKKYKLKKLEKHADELFLTYVR